MQWTKIMALVTAGIELRGSLKCGRRQLVDSLEIAIVFQNVAIVVLYSLNTGCPAIDEELLQGDC